MKRTKTKTEITVEKRERITVRISQPRAVWCEQCAAEVLMLTPERAAEMVHVRTRAIYSRVETAELHFAETEEGELLICSRSLGGAR